VERGEEAVRRPFVLSPSAGLQACQEGKVDVFFCLYWMRLERSGQGCGFVCEWKKVEYGLGREAEGKLDGE
jgi:hypothetical protein